MKTKLCKMCKTEKLITCFSKDTRNRDGLAYTCKECCSKMLYNYRKSKDGIVTITYNHQEEASIKRNHNMPTYTKEELRWWLFSQQLFHDLYDKWVESKFNRWQKPSVDRIDNSKGYSLDNIQLVTWRENRDNFTKDLISGKCVITRYVRPATECPWSKPVVKCDLDNNFIEEYDSINHAAKESGFLRKNIKKACDKKWSKYNGFVWEWKQNFVSSDNRA